MRQPSGGQGGVRDSSRRPLKGRKRFMEDLSELSAHPESISRSGQWSVESVKPSEEEASLSIVISSANEGKTQKIILVVSDSSLYPNEHAFFGYSQDAGALESEVARVIDELPNKSGSTLREAIEFFVEGMSGGGNHGGDETNEEGDGEADFMIFDEDFEQPASLGPSRISQLSLDHLKRDFVGVKAAGYNPGILWTDNNRFILSVSFPVSDLFQHIVPHALLAWDRRFLDLGLYLTLLISGFKGIYPVLQKDGTLVLDLLRTGSNLKFKIGLSQQYKPSVENAIAAFCDFSIPEGNKKGATDGATTDEDTLNPENGQDLGVFRRMSLSTSLESLLDQQLLRLLQLRRRFSLGWAAAEELLWQAEITQQDISAVSRQKNKELELAELDEKKLSRSNNLPSDPIQTSDSEMNILKIAFAFLLRRLALSTRHCVVCHKKLGGHENLRPYVCSSGLCVYQYYSLNLGPSIEHEIITNPGTVDLLVSLAYVSAEEGALDEPLPRGMGLRVRPPANSNANADKDGLCELDSLDIVNMRRAVVELLASLPPIKEMKEYIQRQFAAGNTNARLNNVAPDVLPAAWSILRWCVASCTAHIQELTEPEDRLTNLSNYRQFRFLVGAPDKEKKFLSELPGNHSALFAFHGSPLRNWHSIIRHGLWYKETAHGRSHGNGVYFCQDASVSLSSYAQPSSTMWKNSMIKPKSCCTLAEIVNRRQKFIYNSPPYFVVDKTDWIMCRYLLVQSHDAVVLNTPVVPVEEGVKYLKQDRGVSTKFGEWEINVPQPSYRLDKLVKACVLGRRDATLTAEDYAVFNRPKEVCGPRAKPDSPLGMNTTSQKRHAPARVVKEWKPDDQWILRNAGELLPPPTDSSVTASVALKREFRSMMREQNMAVEGNNLTALGWYLSPRHNGDNLYQWLVELHSFDPDLPIAKDMKSKGVASVAVEIRFPPSFPHAPPFFRVIRPRFRPFVEGGGGHVTLGGSICMDLLTSDGWLPSYCVAAVLLQIKLALSSTTPYPARLQHDWDRAYTPEEALNGYIRAANFHNWRVKNAEEIRKLVTTK